MDNYDDASFQIPAASNTFLLAEDDGADFLNDDTTIGTPFPTRTAPRSFPSQSDHPSPAGQADLTLADLTPSRLRSGRARLPTPVKPLRRSPRKKAGSAAPEVSSPLKQAVVNNVDFARDDTLSPFRSPPPAKPKVFNSPVPKMGLDYKDLFDSPAPTPRKHLRSPSPKMSPATKGADQNSPIAGTSAYSSPVVFKPPPPREYHSPSKSPFKMRRLDSPSKNIRSTESSFQIPSGKENVDMLMDEESMRFLVAEDDTTSFGERSLAVGDRSVDLTHDVTIESEEAGEESGMEQEDEGHMSMEDEGGAEVEVEVDEGNEDEGERRLNAESTEDEAEGSGGEDVGLEQEGFQDEESAQFEDAERMERNDDEESQAGEGLAEKAEEVEPEVQDYWEVAEQDAEWQTDGTSVAEEGRLTLSQLSPTRHSQQARTPEPADVADGHGRSGEPMTPSETLHAIDAVGLDRDNSNTAQDQDQFAPDETSAVEREDTTNEGLTETGPVALGEAHDTPPAKPEVVEDEDEVIDADREPVVSAESNHAQEDNGRAESSLASVGSPPPDDPGILDTQRAALPTHSVSNLTLVEASTEPQPVTDAPQPEIFQHSPSDTMQVDSSPAGASNVLTERLHDTALVPPKARIAPRTGKGRPNQNTVGDGEARQKKAARPQRPPPQPITQRAAGKSTSTSTTTAGLRRAIDPIHPPPRSASRAKDAGRPPHAGARSDTGVGAVAAAAPPAASSRAGGPSRVGANTGSGARVAQAKRNTVGPVRTVRSARLPTSRPDAQTDVDVEHARDDAEKGVQEQEAERVPSPEPEPMRQASIEQDVEMECEVEADVTSADQEPVQTGDVASAPAPDAMDVDEEGKHSIQEDADQVHHQASGNTQPVEQALPHPPSPMRSSTKRTKDESESEEDEEEGPRRKRGRTGETGGASSQPVSGGARPIAGRRAVRTLSASQRGGGASAGGSGLGGGGEGAAKGAKREARMRVASRTGQVSASRVAGAAAHLASDAPPADAAHAPAGTRPLSSTMRTATRTVSTGKERPTATLPAPPKATRPAEFRFVSDTRIEARHAASSSTSSASTLGASTASTASTLLTSVGSSTNASSTSRRRAPIPDFKAIHQAEEARLAAIREQLHAQPTHVAPLAFATEQRAAEREAFERARRAREEAAQREAEARRRAQEDEEERAYQEARRRTVPKANEVPEWYAAMPKKPKSAAESQGVDSAAAKG